MSEKSLVIENMKLKEEIKLLQIQIAVILGTLKEVVTISDRKHDAWDKAHLILETYHV
jgi:hypothetical protein